MESGNFVLNYHVLIEQGMIASNHKIMYDNLNKVATKRAKAKLGSPVGSFPYKCRYSEEAGIWWHRSSNPKSGYDRYWNPFGIGEPDWKKNTNMLLQINYKRKYDRMTNGALVQDDAGVVYVAHNGRSGGSRMKNPRIKIPKNHRIRLVLADDGRKDYRKLFLISDIKSPRLAKNIREYMGFFTDVKEKPSGTVVISDGNPLPKKATEAVTRFIRDSSKVRQLKKKYNDKCQICGGIIQVSKETRYSEVHHIHPLKDGGTDSFANMLVLCPTHHVKFDYNIIGISRDKKTVITRTGKPIGKLRISKGHKLDVKT